MYLLELSWQAAFNEYPQHTSSWRNKKNNVWISHLLLSGAMVSMIIFQLVVTYGDGVVEKRKIPEEVSKVVNMMLKGNYSFLTREALMALSLGGK